MKFNSLIPELSVSDIDNSISFYVDILGFNIEYQREEVGFAFLVLGNVQIMIEKNNDTWTTGKLSYPYGRGINLQIEVDDISLLLGRLKNEKYPIFVEPEDHWYRINNEYYGVREFLVLDPDGYLLRFSQELGMRPE
ncbi:MAG: aldoketomutase [Firmicutes bacterium]|nr:aldoketomutase [Bacillota bacterium]